jgi:hypothetical protein
MLGHDLPTVTVSPALNQQPQVGWAAEDRIQYTSGKLRATGFVYRFSRCKASENAAEMDLYRSVTLGHRY